MVNGFQLRDAADNFLAESTAGPTSVDQIIADFTAPEVRYQRLLIVMEPSVDYSLVVTKNSTFDKDANNTAALAQVLTGTQDVLGYFGPEVAPFTDGYRDGQFQRAALGQLGGSELVRDSSRGIVGTYSARAGDDLRTMSIVTHGDPGDHRGG